MHRKKPDHQISDLSSPCGTNVRRKEATAYFVITDRLDYVAGIIEHLDLCRRLASSLPYRRYQDFALCHDQVGSMLLRRVNLNQRDAGGIVFATDDGRRAHAEVNGGRDS